MLTATEIRRFHDRGLVDPFVVFDESEMVDIREQIKNRVFQDESPPSGYFANARHLDSRLIYDLCAHPKIVGRLRSLYGPDLVLWNSAFWIKSPGDSTVPWHQDLHYWPMDPPLNFSVWLAITEATPENGGLIALPGSHLEILPVVDAGDEYLFARMTDPKVFDPSDSTQLTMRPGEAVIFNDRLLHCSPPNRTAEDRIGLVGRFTLPFVQLFQDRLPLFPQHHTILVSGEGRFSKNRSGLPPASS